MKKNWPIIILISIAIALCFQNYTPGTILSGWDTLHPEFNFGLAIKREIFGVFRTYQGLGAVAAHSDMADLPRIIVLTIFNLFLPMSFLRYSYIFLTLILGPIGMYFFLRYIFVISNGVRNPNGIPKQVRDDTNIPSFLGALFYLLNLGTMQQFIVPFEMFTTQYASLPWLFLFATEYFNTKTHQKKTLILFAITTLLSTPIAYAATLWYIYFIAFILYVGLLSLLKIHLGGVMPFDRLRAATSEVVLRHSQTWLGRLTSRLRHTSEVNPKTLSLAKKAFTLILLTLLINSFWILPSIYFVLNHASDVTQANINKLFSPQAFLYNKEFGNIKDISLLKTFLFDWNVYVGNNQFTQLLSPWIQHLKEPFVELLGYLFALLAFVGIIYSILKRNKILIALLPLLFLCLLFLFNDNFPTSYFYGFIADKIPFFKEIFRFPQDKVLGIFTFVFAIYFAFGQLLITRILSSIKYPKSLFEKCHSERSRGISLNPNSVGRDPSTRPVPSVGMHQTVRPVAEGVGMTSVFLVQIIIFVILLLYFMLPAFKGNFISPYMRIKIPEVYFEMFKWFDKGEEGRIANLPINSLWGWDYHNWYDDVLPSFQGAGFIWFGIKQPILARDFDRWSPYNEQYYREMSYAIYSENPAGLKQVIEKYNIKYILIDKSIIAPQNNSKVLLHQETQTLLDKQEYIEKVKEFGNNLIVYKVDSSVILSASEGSHGILRHPPQNDKKIRTINYPFRNITDNQNKILPNIIKLTQEGVVIKLPKNTRNLTLPSYLDTEESVPSDLLVEKNQNQLNITFYPRFPIYDVKDQPIPIVTKINLPDSEDTVLSINKKDNFILETLTSNTPLSLGEIFLNTKSDNTIAIYPAPGECHVNAKNINPWCGVYPSTPNEKITPDLSTIKYYIEPCQDTADQRGRQTVPSFGIENVQPNSFNIFGKNTHLCMTIPLSELIKKDLKYPEALLNVTFNYKSNLPLKFCLAKLINGACQNYSDNRLNHYFGLQEQDIQDLGLQFSLDSTESNKIVKASYGNLSLNLTYPFFTDELSLRHSGKPEGRIQNLQALRDSGLARVTGIELDSTFSTLILPYSGNKELSSDITKLPKTSGFCPNTRLSNPKLIKKQILENNKPRTNLVQGKDHFIRYTSIDGLSCDHFSYQNLSQNQAYLIAITSRNIKGLPSTLCITNTVSKHCDIYAALSSFKDFDTDIFLLPPQIKNENGFDINIGNLGIKKSPSINDLKSIEIIPFPYKWLSQIRHSGEPEPVEGDSKISNVLVLPQSFEKGWKAYQVQSSKFKVQSFLISSFPFFFGEELKEHVLVNSWENGWLLDSSRLEVRSKKLEVNSSEFVVVFLPQYLEYLGFILLLGTAVWLIFLHRPTPENKIF